MYTVGDKIAYPMHGAGIIEGIEEKKILGENHRYYLLRVPYADMQIMLPVDGSDNIGVRLIISDAELSEILEVLKQESTPMPSNWNRRNRENMERLKTGDLKEVSAVIRNLVRIDREKRLSAGERKLLTNAKNILISEIMLVKDITFAEADELICSMI
ncbi:MAG: CarD family transcriptional regulator [Clostridia bacterium]|nr:CarD family transcriptional regulator [Clostridia bacterium]